MRQTIDNVERVRFDPIYVEGEARTFYGGLAYARESDLFVGGILTIVTLTKQPRRWWGRRPQPLLVLHQFGVTPLPMGWPTDPTPHRMLLDDGESDLETWVVSRVSEACEHASKFLGAS